MKGKSRPGEALQAVLPLPRTPARERQPLTDARSIDRPPLV